MGEFLDARWQDILFRSYQHTSLVVQAIILATVIALALAVLVTNYRPLAPVANALPAIGLTIPGLALLGLMIPLVGIGTLPSVIIVVFYAVLPILRNAVVGLQAVSPDLVEAARGQGMSSVAVFFRVRLPLAWPVIITGIRVSAHMSMGVAAIAAYALGPGLGSYIYTGLSQIGNANALNYALASSAVSICGVSAAIAAAGAVKAKKEHLAYTATMVIAFELPSISILPWLADLLGLSPAVAGVWIGGNIDTTAAVSAAGAPAGEDSLQIASIVKVTQNALIGVVAVALTAWFALRVERDESAPRIRAIDFWHRFPKFVLGFIAASVAVTVAAEFLSEADLDGVDSAVKGFRDYFLTLAFVSVGLEFEAKALREAGMKPVAVFAAATLFNIVLGLALATLLFSNFEV
ncbi:MAG TPA: putative sulfate exporter family transporter [Corynebacterium variabile]|uniref:putative sulfate exporter family transporter n=1 Tax=Corynebacterium variabile TaxID=1727 RepID=UPI000EBEA025|nr:putative sulfate exporter family transporter [Corynebacterium variabile]HAJ52328.1 putative sulfate exporter family transporter [Corynebacterium variabile]